MIALWTAIIEGLIAAKDFAMKLKLFDRRKSERRRGQQNMLFGKLKQQVKDLTRQVKTAVHEINRMRPQLDKCRVERATCNANYDQLMKRVASLERRVP